jgi:hypothetical protein
LHPKNCFLGVALGAFNVERAILFFMNMLNETPTRPHGRPGPKPMGYTAKFAVRLPPALRQTIRVAAQSAGVSINTLLIQQLSSANCHDEQKQVRPN